MLFSEGQVDTRPGAESNADVIVVCRWCCQNKCPVPGVPDAESSGASRCSNQLSFRLMLGTLLQGKDAWSKGKTETLLHQRTKRFATVAESTRSRLRAALVEQLDRGVDAVLEARRLQYVLDAVEGGGPVLT